MKNKLLLAVGSMALLTAMLQKEMRWHGLIMQ